MAYARGDVTIVRTSAKLPPFVRTEAIERVSARCTRHEAIERPTRATGDERSCTWRIGFVRASASWTTSARYGRRKRSRDLPLKQGWGLRAPTRAQHEPPATSGRVLGASASFARARRGPLPRDTDDGSDRETYP